MKRFLVALLLALTGCATPSAQKSADDQGWAFQGRVAIKHSDDSHSANLNWTHHTDGDEILLSAPFGQTLARIALGNGAAHLEADGRQYHAQDAESLTESVLGWRLPLSGLRHWLRAEAAPDSAAASETGDGGQLMLLRQDGWEIRYLRYFGPERQALPKRMQLKRAGLEITLIIDQWTH